MRIDIQSLSLSTTELKIFIVGCNYFLLDSFQKGKLNKEFTELEWEPLKMSPVEITPYLLFGFKVMSKYLKLHGFILGHIKYDQYTLAETMSGIAELILSENNWQLNKGKILNNADMDSISWMFIRNSYMYSKEDFYSALSKVVHGECLALAAYELNHPN